MELPRKKLEQLDYTTKTKFEKHKLIVMDKSIHEKHLFQPLKTNFKQLQLAITFLTGCNRVFKMTNRNSKFNFTVSTNDDGLIQVTNLSGAH